MMFFDPNNKPITVDQWRKTYQPYYFLGGPTYRRTLNLRNQSSRYVETEIEKLLNRPQAQLLTSDHWKLLMAWKLGAVDHKLSERTVIFHSGWQNDLISRGQWGAKDFSMGIHYLGQNMKTLEGMDAKDIFDLLDPLKPQLPNFGPVYWLTAIYFVKRGQWPIFDKFAWVAVHAILAGAMVGTKINYLFDNRSLEWADYPDYVDNVKTIFARQKIPRQDDQALWVYGHFFDVQSTGMPQKHASKANASTRPHMMPPQGIGFGSIVQDRFTDPNDAVQGEEEVWALIKSSFRHVEPLYGRLRSRIAERMPHLRAELSSGGEGWIKFRNTSPHREARRQYSHFFLALKKRGVRIEIWFDKFAPAKERVEAKGLDSAMDRKSSKGFYITKEDQIDDELISWLEMAE